MLVVQENIEEDNTFIIEDAMFSGEVKSLHSCKTTNVIILALFDASTISCNIILDSGLDLDLCDTLCIPTVDSN